MYKIFIPYVNNIDCLKEAINSLGKYKDSIIVIDNSPNQDLEIDVKIIKPEKPLKTAQTFNFMFENGEDIFFFMHSDAVASETAYEQLSLKTEELREEKWGMIFTNYDSFASFNKKAFLEVGGADEKFTRYFFDNDLYRRVRLEGYKEIKTDIEVQHKASMTIKSDPNLMAENNITFPLEEQYYIQKWGGKPQEEIYIVPFNKY
jgi:hypothetical protein